MGSNTGSNVLELSGAQGDLTVNYVGLHLRNFGTVEFGPDDGHDLTLEITHKRDIPSIISGFDQVHDSIDLTQLAHPGKAAITFDSGDDLLTVTEKAKSVTFHLVSNDYSGVTWQAASDGHGGTEIEVAGPNAVETGAVPGESWRAGYRTPTNGGWLLNDMTPSQETVVSWNPGATWHLFSG